MDKITWDSGRAAEYTDDLLRARRVIDADMSSFDRAVFMLEDLGAEGADSAIGQILDALYKLKKRLILMDEETERLRNGVLRCAEMFDDTEHALVRKVAGLEEASTPNKARTGNLFENPLPPLFSAPSDVITPDWLSALAVEN